MRHRHPAWPTLWLMTDERQGEALWPALAALPRGSGVVVRHHRTAPAERSALHARIARIAARRGLMLAHETADGCAIRIGWSAGAHIARVHNLREARAARRAGAAAIFVSPVHTTRTHPGQRALGPVRAARIAQASGLPAIALGGMTARGFARLRRLGFVGWAAIDALTPGTRGDDQKWNAVPI